MTNVIGDRGHLDAVEQIREAGRDPADPDQYLRSYAHPTVKAVMAREGIGSTADSVVTDELFQREVGVELMAMGYLEETDAPEAATVHAVRVVRDRVGVPGQPRKDAAAAAQTRREQLVDRAIAEGRVRAGHRDHWLTILRDNEEYGLTAITRVQDPALAEFRQVERYDGTEHVVPVDDTGLELHLRAEEWLEQTGLAARSAITGELEYDASTYMQGLEHVRDAMVTERTKANLRARGIAESEWTSDGRETKVYAEAWAAVERRLR